VPAPAASSPRSITAWLPSTNSPPVLTIACTRRAGRRRVQTNSARTLRTSQWEATAPTATWRRLLRFGCATRASFMSRD
jgi:hypothetical protein